MGKLLTVALASIAENPVALRVVDTQCEQFLGLVDSIRTKGFMGAITVREKGNGYELVDGLHRYTASKIAGIEMINVDVIALDDAQVLEAQIMANIHRVETKPVEYSKQLLRILASNQTMTEGELATKLAKSPSWIRERLGLLKISNEKIAGLINDGKISLANAYALAKLPSEEMVDYVDRAVTLPPDEFLPAVNARAKEIREAKRKGQDPAAKSFTPVAYMRKLAEVKAEMDSAKIARELVNVTGVSNPVEAFQLGVKWVMNMDQLSVAAQKAKYDEQQALKDEANRKRKEAAAAKKAEAAANDAAAAAAAHEATVALGK